MVPRKKLSLAVIPGDGTGPEVTAEAMKVLGAVASSEGFDFEAQEFPYGGQYYLDTGQVLPRGRHRRVASA